MAVENKADSLKVLWHSPDKETALSLALLYTKNAKLRGWWENIEIIIWGGASVLAATDKDVQDEIKDLMHIGIVVKACRGCAIMYGVEEEIAAIGVTVLSMGPQLSEYLKEGYTVLSV